MDDDTAWIPIKTQSATLRCKSPACAHIRPIAVESSVPRYDMALQLHVCKLRVRNVAYSAMESFRMSQARNLVLVARYKSWRRFWAALISHSSRDPDLGTFWVLTGPEKSSSLLDPNHQARYSLCGCQFFSSLRFPPCPSSTRLVRRLHYQPKRTFSS